MSTYVIGDVQGCFTELQQLLGAIAFDESQDELWFAGDLINRGPDSLACVEFIMASERCKTVLGNHDLHFLAVALGAQKPGRSDTLDELLASPRLVDIIDWYRQQPLLMTDARQQWVMVHAGIPHIWSLERARKLAGEVEDLLKSENYAEFFHHMYGNQPDLWHNELKGYDRLRLITNYLTRMRYITAAGQLELTHKADIQPEGYQPWFGFHPQLPGQTRILFGHWAALEGKTTNPVCIALDTGCVWGRKLTCMRLDDGQLFSVPAAT